MRPHLTLLTLALAHAKSMSRKGAKISDEDSSERRPAADAILSRFSQVPAPAGEHRLQLAAGFAPARRSDGPCARGRATDRLVSRERSAERDRRRGFESTDPHNGPGRPATPPRPRASPTRAVRARLRRGRGMAAADRLRRPRGAAVAAARIVRGTLAAAPRPGARIVRRI